MSKTRLPLVIKELDQLYDLWWHWNKIRGNRHLPDSSDFRLEAVAATLPNAVVLQRIAPANFIVRLSGSELVKRSNVELTGQNVLDLIYIGRRDEVIHHYNTVLSKPCCGHSRFSAHLQSGAVQERVSVLLPLRSSNGQVDQLVSVSCEVGEAGWLPGEVTLELGRDYLEMFLFDV